MNWTLGKICKTLKLEFQGPGELPLRRVTGLDDLAPGTVAFVNEAGDLEDLEPAADCVLVAPEGSDYSGCALVFSSHPLSDHVRITRLLHPGPRVSGEIHPATVVGSRVKIGKNVTIDANVVIGDDVSIGNDCVIRPGTVIMEGSDIGKGCLLYPNVSIREYSSIGDRVVLHNNVSIGADGYGYFYRDGVHNKIPQIGTVRIDDDVEVGASSCIDRARFSVTHIGEGTRIDNLVQVGHNVRIGKHCILVSGVAIAGSTVLGDGCVLAGQVGIIDHITLGNRVTVLAKAAVLDSFPEDDLVLAGNPARPARLWKRMLLRTQQLDSLFKRVDALEKKE